MLNGLDLFSGIGGISLALKQWVIPLTYCEIDPYCQGILINRMYESKLFKSPIWDDIKTLNGCIYKGSVDIIYGGFPCQDISIGGNGVGLAGERSGLFFEIVRLAEEIKPKFIFLENVPAITCRGGIKVVREVTELGYDCRWCVVSANEFVDQDRERWFLLAKSRSMRCEERPGKDLQQIRASSINEKPSDYKLSSMERWAAFAKSVRETDGVPRKVDRIRALGNAVVPAQCKKAFEILMGLKSYD